MTHLVDKGSVAHLPSGSHICLVVTDDGAYGELAAEFLAEGRARGEKTVSFGPEHSPLLTRLQPVAAITADPHVTFLGGHALEPATMFAMFREQAALARREGHTGLRVAADMDWLLSAAPTPDEIVGFEVLLDRIVSELGTTVLCAYRRTSFDRSTIVGTLCVHPVRIGHDDEPPFTFVAEGEDCWRLSGDVDAGGAAQFAGAFAATAKAPCVIDVRDLGFIDVTGMRAIAEAARAAGVPVQFRNANRSFQRYWELAGFDQLAPTVALTG